MTVSGLTLISRIAFLSPIILEEELREPVRDDDTKLFSWPTKVVVRAVAN